jgi:pilus assembly protein Flp/PilA
MKHLLAEFTRDERGATAIEYSLLGSLIAVVIIVSLQMVGSNLVGLFERVAAALT